MNVVIPPHWLAAGALTVGAVLILVFAQPLTRRPGGATAIGVAAAVVALLLGLSGTGVPRFAVAIVALLTILALLLVPSLELEVEDQRPEMAALLLLGSVGAIALASATDFIALVIGLETLSLGVAILVALGRGEKPLEAAFKYFVLAAVSISALVYGIGLYYLSTGSLNLGAPVPPNPSLQVAYLAGLVLIALGLGFELAVVPLHWGALDAYTGAAPGVACWIMAASKLGAVLALSRLAEAHAAQVGPILVLVGSVTIVWGTVAALAQRGLRRLLAYSAVAHAGFLALAAGSGPEGRQAAAFYVAIYGATAMLVFGALAGRGTDELPFAGERDECLAWLRRLGPLRGLGLAVGLLSLAGVPPTPGFWAKLAVLGPAWQNAGALPCLVAIVGGVAGALYYLKPLPDVLAVLREAGLPRPLTNLSVTLAGVAVVALGIAPGIIWALLR